MALEMIWQQAQILLDANGAIRARAIASDEAARLERDGNDDFEDWLAIADRIDVLAKLKAFDA